LGGTHGFGESEDAMWMNMCPEKAEPLADVIPFEQSVGRKVSSAGAVSSRVGKKNAEAVSEKELSVSGHTHAIVAESVEENDSVAVAAVGVDGPSAECNDIWSGDGNIFEIGVEVMRNVAHSGLGLRG